MGNIIGLKRGTVKLVSHNKQWRDLFGKEKNKSMEDLQKITELRAKSKERI